MMSPAASSWGELPSPPGDRFKCPNLASPSGREARLDPDRPNPPGAVVTADVPPHARRERCPRTRREQQRGGSTRIWLTEYLRGGSCTDGARRREFALQARLVSRCDLARVAVASGAVLPRRLYSPGSTIVGRLLTKKLSQQGVVLGATP